MLCILAIRLQIRNGDRSIKAAFKNIKIGYVCINCWFALYILLNRKRKNWRHNHEKARFSTLARSGNATDKPSKNTNHRRVIWQYPQSINGNQLSEVNHCPHCDSSLFGHWGQSKIYHDTTVKHSTP